MKINFLILFLFISLAKIILSSTTNSASPTILKKNEKITINEGENVVIFESDSFNEGDKMSFKITAVEFDNEVILFEFYDDYDIQDFQMENEASPERSKNAEEVYNSNDWVGTGTTNFYTIKKDKKYFKTNVKGKYLGIYIDAPGKILVENYKKDDSTIIVIIAVVIVVVIIVIGIICYCVRKKRQAQMNNQNNINVNNNAYQGNYGYGQQQNNPNYNMNMNMNQGPGYNNGYGYNNNMGYNNNTPYANNPQQYGGVPQNSNTMRYG